MAWQLEIVVQHKRTIYFQYDKLHRNAKFVFQINPTFVYHPLWIIISGQKINLNLFHDTNMLTKNEWCKDKSKISSFICTHYCQCYFLIHDIGERHKKLSNNNLGMFGHIKAHNGSYEIAKNGSLYMHTLLWFDNFLDPNTFIQSQHYVEIHWENMICYLNDITTWKINQYKLCPTLLMVKNCIYNNLDHIHPCIVKPPNTKTNYFLNYSKMENL
jgi:hypothetical protein